MIRVQKLLWLNRKRYSFENVFFLIWLLICHLNSLRQCLPHTFCPSIEISIVIGYPNGKKVSHLQMCIFFSFRFFFILIIEEIALQYEGLGFKKLSPICRSKSYSTNFLTGQPNFIYSTYMKLGWSGRKFVLEPLDQF